MAGITHLVQFQKPGLKALVDLTVKQQEMTFADTYLPTVQVYDRNFAYDIVQTNEYIAAYLGFGAEPPYIDRDSLASKMGTIAYFGLGDIVTYEELQAIHEARNNNEKTAVIQAITLKNIKILNGLNRLMYVAKMEALFKGTHTFSKGDGEKNQITFDFGIPAGNKVALTAGADFNTDTFDAIGWLMDQVKLYKAANNGKAPEVMIGSVEIQSKLLKNKNIIVEAGRPEGSTRVSVDQLNAVLASFRLPALTIIDERTVTYKRNGDNTIVTRELVPVNRLTFLSKGIGEYRQGPTLENNFQPGLYLEAEDLKHPLRSVLQGFGAGFPTPAVPSLIRHMDVYTP